MLYGYIRRVHGFLEIRIVLQRNSEIIRAIIFSFLAIVLLCLGDGCDVTEAPYDDSRLEEIERVIVFDVGPSRNPGVYSESIEKLATYTQADFDLDLFRRYIKSSKYSRGRGSFHMGGNLLIVCHKDGSEHRMMITYNGSLRSQKKGIYVSENDGIKYNFRKEHRRIVVDIFIPRRKRQP